MMISMPKKIGGGVPPPAAKPVLRDPTSGAAHPGTVEFVNGDDGTSTFEDAAELPHEMAFVSGVPVTKVVSRALPNGGREAVLYSASGKALEVNTFVQR